MKPNPKVTCDSCGTHTGMDTHCCGRCAEDSNTRDVAAGLRRINGRRKANGLLPIEREVTSGRAT